MLTEDKVKERQATWAERWRIARLAAKAESAEELDKLAEETGCATASLRNYAGVARQYKAKEVRGLIGKTSFSCFEVLRGEDDRLALIKKGIDVAGARRLVRERKEKS